MSGALNLNIVPINTNKVPPSGAKAAIFNVPWVTTNPFGTYRVNLQQQDASGQFEFVQSVYADNSTCPYQVTLVCDQTGQKIIVKPFSQGYYPLVATVSPSFTATLNYVSDIQAENNLISPPYLNNVTTKFFFMSALMQQQINSLEEYGNNFSNYCTEPLALNPSEFYPFVGAQGANTHFLVSSISLSGTFSSVLTSSGYLFIQVLENGGSQSSPTSFLRAATAIKCVSGDYAITNTLLQFPIPFLTFNSNAGLALYMYTDLGSIVLNLTVTINYGTVIIQ